MKPIVAFIVSLAASALANLPPESRDFGKIKIPDGGLVTPTDHTVENDGCGLVTFTVPLRIGETWEQAEIRAKLIGDAWKRKNPNHPVSFESAARHHGKNGRRSIVRHLLDYQPCGQCPMPAPAPPPRKP